AALDHVRRHLDVGIGHLVGQDVEADKLHGRQRVRADTGGGGDLVLSLAVDALGGCRVDDGTGVAFLTHFTTVADAEALDVGQTAVVAAVGPGVIGAVEMPADVGAGGDGLVTQLAT